MSSEELASEKVFLKEVRASLIYTIQQAQRALAKFDKMVSTAERLPDEIKNEVLWKHNA